MCLKMHPTLAYPHPWIIRKQQILLTFLSGFIMQGSPLSPQPPTTFFICICPQGTRQRVGGSITLHYLQNNYASSATPCQAGAAWAALINEDTMQGAKKEGEERKTAGFLYLSHSGREGRLRVWLWSQPARIQIPAVSDSV